jgi:predicted DNA-binding transcriptional regulator AlpA
MERHYRRLLAGFGDSFLSEERRMSEIFHTPGAAQYVRLGESTLEKMRVSGTGPKFVRLGARRIAYLKADLDEWIAAQPRYVSTSDHRASPRRRALKTSSALQSGE